MRLEAVNIKRFRSIQTCEIVCCGDFNVIIGKNNSGKSNVLSAVDAFFSCLRGDNIVVLDPSIGKTIDFFDNDTRLPIEITLAFSLQKSERESLYYDIVTEAPQMKYAVDGMSYYSKLYITINAINVSHPRVFVSKIVLRNDNVQNPQEERVLLSIGQEAALELCDQAINARQVNRDLETLFNMIRRIDADDWRRLVRDIGSGERPISERIATAAEARDHVPIRSLLRRVFSTVSGPVNSVTNELLKKIESIMVEPTYEDFSRAVQAVANSLKEEAAAIPEKVLKNKIYTFAGEESSIPKYIWNLLQIFSQIKVLYFKEQRKQIGKEEAQRLLSLKVQRGGPKVLRNIQETIAALLGVQVDAFQSETTSINVYGRSEQAAELDVDNFLVEVNGSGIREALRLILDFEFVQPDILLVEEPEIHLHPALETSIMRYLKYNSNHSQVFITTHSTNFIDTAKMENVYLVSKNGSTQVQMLDFDQAETLLPKELGIRLSSLFMFDRLVIVEGSTDADILQEWATILKVNLSQANVGFIATGGSRNFTHYARGDVLSFLSKRRVKIWFLLDRDEREDGDIQRLEKQLGEKASLKVLKKREIENYLLSPRAIVEFIKLKRELSGIGQDENEPTPTEDGIKKLLDECADALKQITIDKRVARLLCRSMHPSIEWFFDKKQNMPITQKIIDENQKMIQQLEEASSKIESVYLAESTSINNVWQSNKLDLVPGDHLLDMVCQKYGVRYKKKEQDGSRLASLMNENEIDKEIKDIIQAIGRGHHSRVW